MDHLLQHFLPYAGPVAAFKVILRIPLYHDWAMSAPPELRLVPGTPLKMRECYNNVALCLLQYAADGGSLSIGLFARKGDHTWESYFVATHPERGTIYNGGIILTSDGECSIHT
jgi:hypothetical protein